MDESSEYTYAEEDLDTQVALLNSLFSADDVDPEFSVPSRADRSKARASFAQRRLWFLNRVDPSCTAYHVPLRFEVRGNLNERLLRETLNLLVERHDVLRTTFLWDHDDVFQCTSPAAPVTLACFDLRGENECVRARRLDEVEREIFFRPFDLVNGPLFRVAWVRLGTNQEALLMGLHHAICDAWSGVALSADLGRIYRALALDQLLPQPSPHSYGDYSEWQHARWNEGAYAEQIEYWKQKLNRTSPLSLPTTGSRPSTPTMRGGKVAINLTPATTRAFESICRSENSTLFMGLLTSFVTLLARYTGQTDITVGSAMAGRDLPEYQNAIGFFLNTIVLRTDLKDSATFLAALEKVRQTTLEAYTHPDVPFEKLVEIVKPDRIPGQNPLFALSFTLNEHPVEAIEVPGATIAVGDPNRYDTGRAKFDLSVHLWNEGQGLGGVFEYSRDLFEPATIERLVRQFVELVDTVARRGDLPLDEIALLSAADQTQLAKWNGPTVTWDQTSFLQRFKNQVLLHPASTAVIDDLSSNTYAELDERSTSLAAILKQLGLRRENPVGVCCERSVALATGFVAAIKSGGVFLPLDPRQPADRLRQMTAEAKPAVVLTDSVNEPLARQLGVPTLLIDGPAPEVRPKNVDESPELSDLAYLIYTSGSTGRPKGVAVEHRSFAHLIDYTISAYGIRPGDRVGLVTGIGFDPAVWELGSFLAAGATLVMASEETRLSPERTQAWILGNRLSLIYMAAPLLDPMLDLNWPTTSSPRLVLTGGDRLRRNPKASIPFRLINLYGPAECTVNVTDFEIPRGNPHHSSAIIGKPLPNFRVHLLDEKKRPVSPGMVGEIYLSGVGLAREYYRNPELTSAAFVPNPLANESGERWYRTGDMARWLDDGTLYLLGRTDGQIKIRGMRIELGEIEAVLGAYPEVESALVVPVKAGAEMRIVGYYMGSAGIATTLRAYLRERLPEAMIPSVIIRVEAFAYTPNGKIDFSKLPSHTAGLEETAPIVALAEGWQTRIAAIWCEVLNCPHVGPDTNFFDAGGHSLLLAAVQAKLAQIPGGEVRLLDLFQYTTVRGLADWMTRRQTPVAEGTAVNQDVRDRASLRRQRIGGIHRERNGNG